jgi:hypothetical protein
MGIFFPKLGNKVSLLFKIGFLSHKFQIYAETLRQDFFKIKCNHQKYKLSTMPATKSKTDKGQAKLKTKKVAKKLPQ